MEFLKTKNNYWSNSKPEPRFNIDKSITDTSLLLAGCKEIHGLSDYKLNKIRTKWADILPELKSVKMLWIAPKINQTIFNAISEMPNLMGLWLKHTSIKHFPNTGFEKIEYLCLGSSPSLGSIERLSHLKSLKYLETENLKTISDFSSISKLTDLEELGLVGSMWTTQKIDTLKPLHTLSKLKHLNLENSRVTDGSLKPLHNLKNLESIHLPLWFKKNEILSLLNANPDVQTNDPNLFS